MVLMRVFSRLDKEGKISIPSNIRRELDLKEGQLVEIKLAGGKRTHYIVIHKRNSTR